MTDMRDLHKKWLSNSKYRAEYDALDEEFSSAAKLVEDSSRADLKQTELPAARIQGTTSSSR